MKRQPFLDAATRCAYATDPTRRPHCQLTAVTRYDTVALCADCDTRRSTLGKGSTPQRLPPTPPLDVLTWITTAHRQLQDAHTELDVVVQRARAHGHSWSAIGNSLNITKQAAQQRFRQPPPPTQA